MNALMLGLIVCCCWLHKSMCAAGHDPRNTITADVRSLLLFVPLTIPTCLGFSLQISCITKCLLKFVTCNRPRLLLWMFSNRNQDIGFECFAIVSANNATKANTDSHTATSTTCIYYSCFSDNYGEQNGRRIHPLKHNVLDWNSLKSRPKRCHNNKQKQQQKNN